MKLSKPRIAPLNPEDIAGELGQKLASIRQRHPYYNIFGTIANNLSTAEKFLALATYVMSETTLPTRDREKLILRTAWLCQSEYEWGQHAIIGKSLGLTDEEIDRIKIGQDAPGWDKFDKTLISAGDELYSEQFICDETWAKLSRKYSKEQLIDLVFTVGQYTMVSMFLNSLGVQLGEGVNGF
jgi:4-carboxymuconolactone decarboxylase